MSFERIDRRPAYSLAFQKPWGGILVFPLQPSKQVVSFVEFILFHNEQTCNTFQSICCVCVCVFVWVRACDRVHIKCVLGWMSTRT